MPQRTCHALLSDGQRDCVWLLTLRRRQAFVALSEASDVGPAECVRGVPRADSGSATRQGREVRSWADSVIASWPDKSRQGADRVACQTVGGP